jgi:hypothetical protein
VSSDVLIPNGQMSHTGSDRVSTRQARRERPPWQSRLLVVYGFVLATLAVVALAVGAAALQDIRDEERQQTKCARALVVATGITPQQKLLVDALNACYETDGR